MDTRNTVARAEMGPPEIAAVFHRAGLRATERRVEAPAGSRWAVWVHASDADLWVEAADSEGAWRKALAYAREVGLLKRV